MPGTRTEPTAPDWACTDCFVLLVNGDIPADMEGLELAEYLDRYDAAMTSGAEITPGMLAEFHAERCPRYGEHGDDGSDCDCETQDFSWSPCGICRSNLGGSRHAVTWWVRP